MAIAVADPDALLGRLWTELRDDPRVADLLGLVPADRKLGLAEGLTLVPAVLAALAAPERQVEVIDAAARAYLRAAGLHLMEE